MDAQTRSIPMVATTSTTFVWASLLVATPITTNTKNAMPVTIKNGLPRYVKPRPGKKKLRTAVIAGFFFFMDTLPSEPNRQWSEPYDIRGHMSNAHGLYYPHTSWRISPQPEFCAVSL